MSVEAFEISIEVPTGVAILPKDLVPAPRQYGERFFNVAADPSRG
jgi:hypothetical protein